MKQEKKRFILAKTKGEDDCSECCFALACINPCREPKGYHYEKNLNYKS